MLLLFLPAHNEAAAVGGVLARVPAEVLGHAVEVLVVDDGSIDATAAVAHAAGADVTSFGANRGLGAAVRFGLAEAVRRGAAAVAFCDADGEYAPEELARLVAPILAGDADYVVGSRFAGGPRRMRLHRTAGNRTLTCLLRVLLPKHGITDGQSGYRALSPRAAAAAEIVHDFNYAQVLTLDLLRKGFRYDEVPISYRFRTTGTSFVRLIPYLRRVVPAVWNVHRRTRDRSVLDDVGAVASEGGAPRGVIVDRGGTIPAHLERVVAVVGHEQPLPAEHS
jgi:glycosyltransferase involved in cell wall biosynthesis